MFDLELPRIDDDRPSGRSWVALLEGAGDDGDSRPGFEEEVAGDFQLHLDPPVLQEESEPSVEARVPTRLVDGPVRSKPHDGRYAGYELVRELVRAPGAVLAEGRDAIGVPWLLQLVRTRAVGDEAERLARQHLEHVVAARTAELLDEPALGLRAHGVVDEPDGTRTMFWVLPWHPRAPRLAADFAPRPSLDTVVRAGQVLARRLVTRHARGRLEPLMSASLLSSGDETIEAALLGFPVLVPPVAAADTMIPPMLAPEERLHAQPTMTGDLWRLGEVLRKLVESCGEPTAALEPLIAQLSEPDPSRRTPRASQVLAELDALSAGRSGDGAGTTQFSALDPGALSALLLTATADSTKVQATELPEADQSVVLSTPDAQAILDAPPPPPSSTQLELEAALGLAVETLNATPSPAPARPASPPAAPPAPSAASMALAPFAVDLSAQGGDTVCEVPTVLRLDDPEDEQPLLRTIVRTRSRPVVERASGNARAPVLDRTRTTPEPQIARPSVFASEETVRITVPRQSAVVVRTEVRVEVGTPEEPPREDSVVRGWFEKARGADPGRDADPVGDADTLPGKRRILARTLRSTPRFALVLTATAILALALGVALGVAIPR